MVKWTKIGKYEVDGHGLKTKVNFENVVRPEYDFEEQEEENFNLFADHFGILDYKNININKNAIGSYSLKHFIERYLSNHFPERNPYISNGKTILKMAEIGFNISSHPDSINCWFNLSSKINKISNTTQRVLTPYIVD